MPASTSRVPITGFLQQSFLGGPTTTTTPSIPPTRRTAGHWQNRTPQRPSPPPTPATLQFPSYPPPPSPPPPLQLLASSPCANNDDATTSVDDAAAAAAAGWAGAAAGAADAAPPLLGCHCCYYQQQPALLPPPYETPLLPPPHAARRPFHGPHRPQLAAAATAAAAAAAASAAAAAVAADELLQPTNAHPAELCRADVRACFPHVADAQLRSSADDLAQLCYLPYCRRTAAAAQSSPQQQQQDTGSDDHHHHHRRSAPAHANRIYLSMLPIEHLESRDVEHVAAIADTLLAAVSDTSARAFAELPPLRTTHVEFCNDRSIIITVNFAAAPPPPRRAGLASGAAFNFSTASLDSVVDYAILDERRRLQCIYQHEPYRSNSSAAAASPPPPPPPPTSSPPAPPLLDDVAVQYQRALHNSVLCDRCGVWADPAAIATALANGGDDGSTVLRLYSREIRCLPQEQRHAALQQLPCQPIIASAPRSGPRNPQPVTTVN